MTETWLTRRSTPLKTEDEKEKKKTSLSARRHTHTRLCVEKAGRGGGKSMRIGSCRLQ